MPTGGATRRHRSPSSVPQLPTTVWLLTTPTATSTTPGLTPAGTGDPAPQEGASRAGDLDVGAEVIRRAVDALAPTTGPTRRHPTIVVTRHAHDVTTASSGSAQLGSAALDSPPAVSPPAVSPPAVSLPIVSLPDPMSSDTTTAPPTTAEVETASDDGQRGGGTGVGLLLLDATRCAGEPVDVEDVAGLLAPGGVLAVLTTSDRVSGRLRDPRPALITSAQAAGLDYWQHIVTTRPRSGQRHRLDGDEPQHPSWCLVADVSVFRRRPPVTDWLEQPAPGAGPDISSGMTIDEVQP